MVDTHDMADSEYNLTYNILPVDNPNIDHAGMSFPEVRYFISRILCNFPVFLCWGQPMPREIIGLAAP